MIWCEDLIDDWSIIDLILFLINKYNYDYKHSFCVDNITLAKYFVSTKWIKPYINMCWLLNLVDLHCHHEYRIKSRYTSVHRTPLYPNIKTLPDI